MTKFNKLEIKDMNKTTIEDSFWTNQNSNLSLNLSFSEILNRVDIFTIPFFQRTYKWTTENIEELLNDIISSEENYFTGQIILKNTKNNNKEFQVIDGQQRITTLLLVLFWLYNNGFKEGSKEKKKIENMLYTKDKNNYEDQTARLFSAVKYENEDDCLDYLEIPQYKTIIEPTMKKMGFSKENEECKILLKKIKKCTINLSKFSYDSNENKLFEKLNSTGLQLSVSDHLRNFLLMKAKEKNEIKSKSKIEKKSTPFFLKYYQMN